MSEADRVFSRMTTPGSLPASEDKQFLHVTSRRRGAGAAQSRVVEVIHRRSGRTAPSTEPMSPPAQSAHAATWPEGGHGRSGQPLSPAEDPAVTPPTAPQIGHLMPGWEPLLPPLRPVEPTTKVPAGIRPQRQVARAKQSKSEPVSTRRSFADPFAADDTGTNCIRCGYRISLAREKRGLMTCMQCR